MAVPGLADAVGLLPDGVYLNLPEEIYFAQKRLGSTDWSSLFLKEEGWWWSSGLNPDYVEPAAEPRTFGKALHAIVLEGEKAYERRFSIMPDKEVERVQHGKKFCDTVKDIITALEERGMHPKANQGKAFLSDYARSRAPDLVIWDVLISEWRAANRHKLGITAREDRQIRVMAEAVRNHPDIGELFVWSADHVPLAEVSVLYTDEHSIRRRVRLDEMLPLTTIDVKTLGNVGNRQLNFFAGEHVAKMAYHVQMADHHVGRKWAYRFIQEGKVFDGTPAADRDDETEKQHALEHAWLRRFPAEAPKWDYAWLFYQKPDAKAGHAPVVFPWGEDYGGDLHMRGLACREEAIATYRRCMGKFGPNKPWTRVEPLHSTLDDRSNKHRVFLPPYIGGDDWRNLNLDEFL